MVLITLLLAAVSLGGVALYIGSLGGSVLDRVVLDGETVSYFRSSITIFFLFNASFNQNFREPKRSMYIVTGIIFPKQSLIGLSFASVRNVFAGYKRVSACTIALLLDVSTPPGFLLWLTHAVSSCLG